MAAISESESLRDAPEDTGEFAIPNETGNPESGDQISTDLLVKADEVSQDPERSLETILHDLVRRAINKHGLLASEFIEHFKKGEIAQKIAQNFTKSVASAFPISLGPVAPSEFSKVKEELLQFIENEFGHKKIFDLLGKIDREYPEIDIYNLFTDQSIQDALVSKINKLAEVEARAFYEREFKENPLSFLREHILPKAISLRPDAMPEVKTTGLKESLRFLQEQGLLDDQFIYQEVYDWLLDEAATIPDAQGDTKFRLQKFLGIDQKAEITSPGFTLSEFDQFFEKNIGPLLSQIRSEVRLKKLKQDPGLADFDDVNEETLSEVFHPVEAIKYFSGISARLKRHGIDKNLAGFLDYYGLSGMEPEALEDELKPDLEKSRQHLEKIIDEGLLDVAENDPKREQYKFIDKISNCTNILDLIQWLGDPRVFLKTLSKEELSDLKRKYPAQRLMRIVAHQVELMLKSLIIRRRHVYGPEYDLAPANKILLDQHILDLFAISPDEIKEVQVVFRVGCQIDDEGTPVMDGDGDPIYDVVYAEETEIKNEPLLQTDNDEITQKEDGTKWKWLPIEHSEKFAKAKGKVRDYEKATEFETEFLFYLGKSPANSNGIVDKKSENSLFSNVFRDGENPTDILRFAMCIKEKDKRDLAKNMIVRNNHMINPVGVKDHDSGRERKKPKLLIRELLEQRKRSKNRKRNFAFQDKARAFSFSGFGLVPGQKVRKILGDNTLGPRQIHFEAKIFGEEMFTYWLSKNGPSSHEAYRQNRDREIMERYLFPATVYGKDFLANLEEENIEEQAALAA